MPTFFITIEETAWSTYRVEADNAADATTLAVDVHSGETNDTTLPVILEDAGLGDEICVAEVSIADTENKEKK